MVLKVMKVLTGVAIVCICGGLMASRAALYEPSCFVFTMSSLGALGVIALVSGALGIASFEDYLENKALGICWGVCAASPAVFLFLVLLSG